MLNWNGSDASAIICAGFLGNWVLVQWGFITSKRGFLITPWCITLIDVLDSNTSIDNNVGIVPILEYAWNNVNVERIYFSAQKSIKVIQ